MTLGFGREWYMTGPATTCGPKWRVGVDGGGRYGTESATFHEIRHRTGVCSGAYLAAHTDVEIPWDHCDVIFGFRMEWSWTWGDSLLQETPANMSELLLMLTAGIRF
jgi:hypothetical protein